MSDPINRTILLADIERFGRHDDVQQVFLRRVLYDVLRDTLRAAGVEPDEARLEDRGDAVMALISSAIPKTRLLKALLEETPAALHGYNRLAARDTQVRLRLVLAEGEVALQQLAGLAAGPERAVEGAVGSDLNQAFRLLNADELRQLLRERADDCVLCVSDPVYRGIVRHGYRGIRPDDFHRISLTSKEGELHAWVHGGRVGGPGTSATQAEPAAASRPSGGGAPPSEGRGVHFTGGSPSFGGSLVQGDQHIVSGGTVRDVHVGNGIGSSGAGTPRAPREPGERP
ncbi:hypothetical protein [Streptacidiphilus rugosus]|uniref:hypothetical protein n=1 Tax=Streptacidiphilus rugosus TaxID=405783 RepID=UPI00068AF89C|nr:hypothetical protein [Streptacidiphilus rugosus]